MSYTGKTPVDYVDIMESQSLVVLNDLTVDTNTLYVDSTNNRVGIGTSSPASALDVTGTVTADGLTVDGTGLMSSTNELQFFNSNYGIRASTGLEIKTGDFTRFLTGATERMRIDSSGNVGIGNSSPESISNYNILDVGSSSTQRGVINAYDGTVRASVWTTNSGVARLGSRSNHPVTLEVSGSEKMRIDSSGNVGIGTSSPDARLSIVDGTSSDQLRMGSGTSYYKIGRNTSTGLLEFNGIQSGFNGYVFGGANGERMRIDSSGNVLVGTTLTAPTTGGIVLYKDSTRGIVRSGTNTTAVDAVAAWYNPNGKVGQIITSGSSTAYNTSSDYRLKENVTGITDGIERVKQLNPSRFNFIADADTTVDGFLAHEAATVVPEAVTGEKDAVDVDGNPEYQGIDQSKLVPLLTAALQEAITKIEDLEARLATLETN